MEKRDVLSESGRNWATLALDPFHDFDIKVCGLPDADTSRVVIESFTESAQISAPTGTTGNWDAHVFSMPIGTTINCSLGTDYNADVFAAINYTVYGTNSYQIVGREPSHVYAVGRSGGAGTGTSNYTMGLLNIDTFTTSGGQLAPTNSFSNFTGGTHVVLGNPPVTFGKRRLIAAGFEIHDTTAQLYKQGTLTSYRIPQAWTRENAIGIQSTATQAAYGIYNGTGYALGNYAYLGQLGLVPYRTCDLPPATIARAMTYPGSRQWEVKDGAYVALSQDVGRNFLSFNESGYMSFTDGDYVPTSVASDIQQTPNGSYNAFFTNSSIIQTTTDTSGTISRNLWEIVPPQDIMRLPYHTSGCMLTGLNVNSTFTVTLRTFWEISPDLGDLNGSVLVPLTEPSPEYDPIALELYQRAVATLPVAVPVGMNAEGDWGDWVLRALSAAAVPVASMLLPVGGAAVGAAASAGLDSMRKRRNQRDALQDKANSKMAKISDSVFKPNVKNVPTPKKKTEQPKKTPGQKELKESIRRLDAAMAGLKVKP
jgi:hypothetical protein